MDGFTEVFNALKPVFSGCLKKLDVKTDTASDYLLETKSPSPFPQHKGRPLFFSQVRIGKAYVSLHLMPVYMSPALAALVTPELKKRMQGKACFNFTSVPSKELLAQLKRLAKAALDEWGEKGWL